MQRPSSTTPGSIMPAYPHLLTSHFDVSLIGAKMRALRTLGVPYSDGEIAIAASTMAAQAATIAAEVESHQGPTALADKEIVALTAELQRLGTHILWNRPAAQPPFAATVTPAPSVPASSGGASR